MFLVKRSISEGHRARSSASHVDTTVSDVVRTDAYALVCLLVLTVSKSYGPLRRSSMDACQGVLLTQRTPSIYHLSQRAVETCCEVSGYSI
jgi:hypothetical protein